MKINVWPIAKSHFRTLYDAQSGKIALRDYAVFFGIPVLLGIVAFYCNLNISKDFYSLSITFYGIFIALLLNIQVAVFGIVQRQWPQQKDDILMGIDAEKLSLRQLLLKELNTNVSYLIVVSCFALVLYIALFGSEPCDTRLAASLSSALYSHFVLTLLMIVKRTHALFQGEYEMER